LGFRPGPPPMAFFVRRRANAVLTFFCQSLKDGPSGGPIFARPRTRTASGAGAIPLGASPPTQRQKNQPQATGNKRPLQGPTPTEMVSPRPGGGARVLRRRVVRTRWWGATPPGKKAKWFFLAQMPPLVGARGKSYYGIPASGKWGRGDLLTGGGSTSPNPALSGILAKKARLGPVWEVVPPKLA